MILVSVWRGGCRWEWAEKIRSAVKYSVWKADKTLLFFSTTWNFFNWFWTAFRLVLITFNRTCDLGTLHVAPTFIHIDFPNVAQTSGDEENGVY